MEVRIGVDQPPFIIAEMSGNHNNSLERALQIVDAAADAGADAIKLQTYTQDTITLDSKTDDFLIKNKESPWHGSYLYDLYEKASTPYEWHEPLFNRAREKGMFAFSSAFDESAVDFLESLNTPMYKIASFENNHIPLIKKAAQTGKPIIISMGMATVPEIIEAVDTAKENGASQVIALKCTSSYPADPKDANLKTIPHMKELLGCEVGLSDHTIGNACSIASVVLGATVIEKHFTLDDLNTVDSSFSARPEELRRLVEEVRLAKDCLGQVQYGLYGKETNSMQFRRSIYGTKDVAAGSLLAKDNIRVVRPGYGLKPKHYQSLIGKKLRKPLKHGEALTWEHIE